MPEPIEKGAISHAPAEIVNPWMDDKEVEEASKGPIEVIKEIVDPWTGESLRSAGDSSKETEIMELWNSAPAAGPDIRMDEYKRSEIVNPWK